MRCRVVIRWVPTHPLRPIPQSALGLGAWLGNLIADGAIAAVARRAASPWAVERRRRELDAAAQVHRLLADVQCAALSASREGRSRPVAATAPGVAQGRATERCGAASGYPRPPGGAGPRPANAFAGPAVRWRRRAVCTRCGRAATLVAGWAAFFRAPFAEPTAFSRAPHDARERADGLPLGWPWGAGHRPRAARCAGSRCLPAATAPRRPWRRFVRGFALGVRCTAARPRRRRRSRRRAPISFQCEGGMPCARGHAAALCIACEQIFRRGSTDMPFWPTGDRGAQAARHRSLVDGSVRPAVARRAGVAARRLGGRSQRTSRNRRSLRCTRMEPCDVVVNNMLLCQAPLSDQKHAPTPSCHCSREVPDVARYRA